MRKVPRAEMDKLAAYCEQTGYTPDYGYLMGRMLAVNPAAAVSLASVIVAKSPPPIDVHTLTDAFLSRNPPLVREATSFLLDVLKPNLPEQAALQTKVLEMNLVTFPNVADAIRISGAIAVDVSSGVESAPGVKDPAKIREFIQAVRRG